MHVGFEVLEPQPHGGERRAELVRRVGDERALRTDELFEARRGRVERLREHGQLRRDRAGTSARDREVAPTERTRGLLEVGERLGHRAGEQEAGQEHDPEHDAAGRREQQPDVADLVVDHRRRVVMRTAPWMPAAEPIGSAT